MTDLIIHNVVQYFASVDGKDSQVIHFTGEFKKVNINFTCCWIGINFDVSLCDVIHTHIQADTQVE